MSQNKGIKLRVAEALQDDAYRGIARIDFEVMKELGIRRGDIITIKGERETVAIADKAYPADVGEGIIRVDGIIRKNARTGVSENVIVTKTEIKEAKKIIIAPAQKGIRVQGDLKPGLLGRAIIKGDIIVLGGVQRRKDLMNEEFGMDDIFGNLNDIFGGLGNLGGVQQIRFIVANTNPNAPCIITENTEVVLSSKTVEISEDSIPEVTYEDIGGLTDEVKKIREMVELPLKRPEIFERLGVEPPKGVLLHGHPGTGKTLLAKAVANESDANFILLNGPEIMSKFYGESEKKIRDIFEEAEKNAPSIIFIDEIDSIAPQREEVGGEVERRVVSQLLTMMDGLQSRGKVVVIAATNRPNSIDPALRRPGRFDRELELRAPDKKGRLQILKIHTRGMPIDHYDEVLTSKILSEKMLSYEGNINQKIEDSKEKVKKLNKDNKDNNNELKKLKEELKELENEKIYTDSNKSLFEKIINKISETKGEINDVIRKIDHMETEKENINNKIKKSKKYIINIKDDIKKIENNRNLLEKISKGINDMRHDLNKYDENDPRAIFIDRNLKESNNEVKDIIQDLLETKIISDELYEDIKKESIEELSIELARVTHGFVGADLSSLAKEAAMVVLRRLLPELQLKEDEEIPEAILKKLVVKKKDFDEALKVVRPSAMREVLVETPNVNWTDVGGLDKIKQELKEAVEWPLKFPSSFTRLGIKAPKGILLYGPPGTGKTLLAKAVAKESEANFIQVKGPSLLSMWVGKSEEGIRKIFDRARQVSPCVVFFDEIDSLAGKRGMETGTKVTERVLNQLLAEMDGIEDLSNVVVIAATNRPDMLDSALLRPGRFDRILLVGSPEKEGREKIFKIHTKNMPLAKDVNMQKIINQTEGYVGADIESLVREAAMLSLRDNIDSKEVKMKYFEEAIKKVGASVTKSDMDRYRKIETEYLRSAKAALEVNKSYLG